MNRTEANRLAKMYSYIENLPLKKLDMDYVADPGHIVTEDQYLKEMKEPRCGTAGCLAGHCPVVFPHLFRFFTPDHKPSPDIYIRWKKKNYCCYSKILAEAFGITNYEAYELGSPTEIIKYSTKSFEQERKIVLKRLRDIADQYDWRIV